MKRFIFCVSLVLTGLMTSCVDKNEEVDANSKPSWLGGSIYAELKDANQERLTGTFTNYLHLIDDLGYAETLNRTGSKTVFPANDDAFERFFKNNEWGVKSYGELSVAQKKLLLYSSMLDNALLLNMLPNASNGTNSPMKGAALKHATNVSVIDSVQFMTEEEMPKGNVYWEKYASKGIDLVCDNTRPMMVHLTREYMLNNDIKTLGEESDFAILTGTPFTEGTAYIFNNRVVKSDITCQNGYIHQMEDVLVPPGNMGQVLRRHSNTKLYSRILDYFSAPYYDETTTRNYNDWAMANNKPQKDSIFQMRYLSTRSQGGADLTKDPNGNIRSSTYVLGYDPGWNQYYPAVSQNTNVDNTIRNIGAFFVPDDKAVEGYFVTGGGKHLIDIYGVKGLANTEANLPQHLDSLFAKKPAFLASFTKNLMKPSFTATVPSKFPNVTNDAGENMGLSIGLLDKKEDGKYDITIANNGVIYVINEMIVPDEFRAVLSPASEYPDMLVMNWAISDGHSNGDYLGLDFKYYLLAMSANYAFFIPTDDAFGLYYIDPTSLGHMRNGQQDAQVLHFYFDKTATRQPYVKCDRYNYDMETGEIDEATKNTVSISDVKTQMVDILNYHTLVLNAGDSIGSNNYYKTKHGGEVFVKNIRYKANGELDTEYSPIVMSGAQIDNPNILPSGIQTEFKEKNGRAYRLNRVIQPPHKSVYALLNENPQFSKFMEACTGFQATDLLTWAGIKADINAATGSSEQDAYTIFTNNYKLGSTSIENACLDYNVKMFNTYNYTLFAPDDAAMEQAYADGLPKWADIVALFEKYPEEEHEVEAAELADMEKAKKMIGQIRDFVRYHFVTNSVYVDNSFEQGRYQSLSSDATGVAKELRITGKDGVMTITDLHNQEITLRASDSQRLVNKMTRDYWFNRDKSSASAITTSSFCAVHQISKPLYYNKNGRFDQ